MCVCVCVCVCSILLHAYQQKFFASFQDGTIDDVTEGAVWQRLATQANDYPFIGLVLSTDGFAPYSGKYSAWPIIASLCNLNPSLRDEHTHMITLGIVPGPTKPKSLDPFFNVLLMKELQMLHHGAYAATHTD